MPTIVTFILIIASFTIASKYELKSIMKKPVKINSPSKLETETPKIELEEDIEHQIFESDSTSQSESDVHTILDGTAVKSLPKEVSIILMSRLQFSFSLPPGT